MFCAAFSFTAFTLRFLSFWATCLIGNPSPRCPYMVAMDTSGSMSGEPIQQFRGGFNRFLQSLLKDEVTLYPIEVGLITAQWPCSTGITLY